jgi:hypothetical protein
MAKQKKKRSKKYKPGLRPMTTEELLRGYHPGALEVLRTTNYDEPFEELMAKLIAIRNAQPWR